MTSILVILLSMNDTDTNVMRGRRSRPGSKGARALLVAAVLGFAAGHFTGPAQPESDGGLGPLTRIALDIATAVAVLKSVGIVAGPTAGPS